MIVYNNRYRGPFEYDKFILNILGFHNMINSLSFAELDKLDENSLMYVKNEIDKLYDKYTGDNGLGDKAHLTFITGRENCKL